MNRQRWRLLIALTGACAVAAACTPASAPQSGGAPAQAAQPKRIVVAIGGNPPAFSSNSVPNPRGINGLDSLDQLLNAGMARMDTSATLQPELAEAVPSVENGSWKVLPDGQMEMTWKI